MRKIVCTASRTAAGKQRNAAWETISLTNGSVWTFADKEILIEENAPVEVAFTKTTAEFIDWLEQGIPHYRNKDFFEAVGFVKEAEQCDISIGFLLL